MTTSDSVFVFDREALRCWLAEHEMRPSIFARAIGSNRKTVERWLAGSRAPEVPIHLIEQGILLGGRAREWSPDQLRRWMAREVYDTSTLALDLGMHRTTVGRWRGDVRPQNSVPLWVPLALAALGGDVAARRARRRAQRAIARAS